MDILESKLSASKNQIKSSRADCLKKQQTKENAAPYNRKKAEFEKKIRKFIEADSPSQNSESSQLKVRKEWENPTKNDHYQKN